VATEIRTGAIYGIGVYGTDTFGVSNTNITVDGVAGTPAVGTVTAFTNAYAPVDGVSATSAVGDVEVDINIIGRPDADIPMAGSVGDVTVTADAPVDVTGVFATNEVGTLPTPDSIYDVVGVQGTTAVNGGYTDKYDGFLAFGNTTNAIYGEGVYGTSRYGYVNPNLFHEVDAVIATGSVGNVSTSADNNTQISAGVFAEIITDAELVVGDEVTIVAEANVVPTGVVGTSAVGAIGTQTTNVFVLEDVSATGSVGNVVVVAEANTSVDGLSATNEVGDVTTTADSNFEVTGVSATGTIDENEVVLNNAIPTFSGVSSLATPGNVTISTTTVIFDVANKDHQRTTYVEPDEPRIVYVRAA